MYPVAPAMILTFPSPVFVVIVVDDEVMDKMGRFVDDFDRADDGENAA